MLGFKKRYLDKNSGSNSLFLKLIEKLLGTKLKSYPLYVVDSIGVNIKSSLIAFIFILIGQILVNSIFNLAEEFLASLSFAASFAGLLFVVTSVADISFLIIPTWYKKVFRDKQSSQFVFITILGAAAICFCLYTSAYHLTAPSAVKLVNDKPKNNPIEKITLEKHKAVKPNIASLPIEPDNIEEMTLDQYNELMERLGIDDFDIIEDMKFIENAYSDIFDSEKKIEDWDVYLSEIDSVAINKPSFLSVAISKALSNKAPFDVVVEILNRGHDLNGNHLSILASSLSIEEFKVLENYGVNISAPSITGSNVLISSLFSAQKDEMFDYFLLKDQVVNSKEIDVFKGLLEASRLLNLDVTYARKALNNGMPVSEGAKSWIENELKAKDLNFYNKVKDGLNI